MTSDTNTITPFPAPAYAGNDLDSAIAEATGDPSASFATQSAKLDKLTKDLIGKHNSPTVIDYSKELSAIRDIAIAFNTASHGGVKPAAPRVLSPTTAAVVKGPALMDKNYEEPKLPPHHPLDPVEGPGDMNEQDQPTEYGASKQKLAQDAFGKANEKKATG